MRSVESLLDKIHPIFHPEARNLTPETLFHYEKNNPFHPNPARRKPS